MTCVDLANKLALANHEDMDAVHANIIAEIQAVRLDVKKELNETIGTLKNELIDFREEVSAKLNDIASELKEKTDRVEAMEQRVDDMEDCNADNAEALTYTLELQQTLQAQLTDLEARSRRNNIRIHCIPEGAALLVALSSETQSVFRVFFTGPITYNSADEATDNLKKRGLIVDGPEAATCVQNTPLEQPRQPSWETAGSKPRQRQEA